MGGQTKSIPQTLADQINNNHKKSWAYFCSEILGRSPFLLHILHPGSSDDQISQVNSISEKQIKGDQPVYSISYVLFITDVSEIDSFSMYIA